MITVNKLLPRPGPERRLLKRAAAVVLTGIRAQKSRFGQRRSQGRQLGRFLPRGTAVLGGDVLWPRTLVIKVGRAAEPVMRITPCAAHGSPSTCARRLASGQSSMCAESS